MSFQERTSCDHGMLSISNGNSHLQVENFWESTSNAFEEQGNSFNGDPQALNLQHYLLEQAYQLLLNGEIASDQTSCL